MDTLIRLLSSRVKAEVFRLLFGPDARELHVREIARRARLNEATVRQELSQLAGLHLVALRRDGNRAYYRAETGNPLYTDIRNIVLKTSGLIDILRTALVEKPGIRLAFVFGSAASGGEKPATDIDLMIIGSVSLRQLSKWLSGAAVHLGREINPHIFTPLEFARRRQADDHFVTSVLSAPKLFVIGTENELEENRAAVLDSGSGSQGHPRTGVVPGWAVWERP